MFKKIYIISLIYSVGIGYLMLWVYDSSVSIKAEHRNCRANMHTSIFIHHKSYCHHYIEQ